MNFSTTESLGLTSEQTVDTTLDPTTASVAPGNRSFLDSEFRYTLFPVFYGVVFVLGLLANGYVLFVLRNLRRSKSMREISIYMTNLTVADLLFVCALPFWIGYYSRHGDWVYSDFLCRLTGSLFFINTYCSILFLATISLNRYWAITRPLAAAASDHWRRAVGVTTVIWAVTLAMAVPFLTSPGVQRDERNATRRCFEGYQDQTDEDKRTVAVTHFLIIGMFVLVFLLVVVCNLLIARALLAQSPSQSAPPSTRSGTSVRYSRRPRGVKLQALQMLCAVLGVFVVCFLPHHLVQGPWTLAVLQISEGWGSTGWGEDTRQTLNDLHQVTLLLMGLNCILDPVVYCFATRKFRQYIKSHLRRMKQGDGCSHTATTQMSMDSKAQSQREPGENLQLQAYIASIAE